MFLTDIHCAIALFFGLIEEKCQELRLQESIDSSLWFKLLFIPTLLIFIITLFLLEDWCYQFFYGHQKITDAPPPSHASSSSSSSSSSSPTTSLHSSSSPSLTTQHHHTNLSAFQFQHPSKHTLLLQLHSEYGEIYWVRVSYTVQFRDILSHYLSRVNHPASQHYHMHCWRCPIADKDTPASLGLCNEDVVHVACDYRALYDELLTHSHDALTRYQSDVTTAAQQYKGMISQWKHVLEHMDEHEEHINNMEEEKKQLIVNKQELLHRIDALKSDIQQHISMKRNAEQARFMNEGSEHDRIEVKRCEKMIANYNKEIEKLKKEESELDSKISRNLKEISDLRDQLKTYVQHADNLQVECDKLKSKHIDMPDNTQLFETLEKQYVEYMKHKTRLDFLQIEVPKLKAEFGSLTQKLQSYEMIDIDNSSNQSSTPSTSQQQPSTLLQLRSRCALLEKETLPLNKWRNIARNLEHEASECNKWKTLAKQCHTREKQLEKEIKDTLHYKQQARAYEKELKELRNTQRQFELNSSTHLSSTSNPLSNLTSSDTFHNSYLPSNSPTNIALDSFDDSTYTDDLNANSSLDYDQYLLDLDNDDDTYLLTAINQQTQARQSNDDDMNELLKLGEALGRRNEIKQQNYQREMNHVPLSYDDSPLPLSNSSTNSFMTNSRAGGLQANAPVFTPRYQLASSSNSSPHEYAGFSSVVGLSPNHSSPFSASPTFNSSPTLADSFMHSTVPAHAAAASNWNSALQPSLMIINDQLSPTLPTDTQSRHRSFSNPSQLHTHLPPSHPMSRGFNQGGLMIIDDTNRDGAHSSNLPYTSPLADLSPVSLLSHRSTPVTSSSVLASPSDSNSTSPNLTALRKHALNINMPHMQLQNGTQFHINHRTVGADNFNGNNSSSTDQSRW